jgi:hypothetical protein
MLGRFRSHTCMVLMLFVCLPAHSARRTDAGTCRRACLEGSDHPTEVPDSMAVSLLTSLVRLGGAHVDMGAVETGTVRCSCG